jgi:DNA helicase-2/ATP-dependent DNA helicase PcrA
MTAITLEVEKLIHEGVPAGRIGVIYKENRYGEELGQYLKLRKIPAFSKRSFNILLLPLTKKIILVLRYLWSEHDIPYSGDELLFEILHMDWFSIPPIEIAKLTTEVADRRYQQNKISLRALLVEKSQAPPKDLFSPTLHAGLGRASAILERLIGEVPNVTLQHLLEQIIREAGVLNRIMADPDKIWLLQVLTAFFDFIKDETGRNPALGLRQLMPMIDLMEKEKLPLPLVQVSGSEKGVNLLTAHGSKGLEFDYVFFVGCNASFWEKKVKNRTGYWFPDTLFTSAPKQHEEEELRRLFYVALTRARQHLLISYSRFKNDGRELEPSMFLAEILDTHALVVERPVIPAEVQAEFLHLHLAREQAPEIQTSETEFVERLLSTFVMNVTALNHYLNCPLEFYFKNLIRIPSPKNESTEFGSAVHYALEQLFRTMQANQQEFAPLETFISWFDWFMERHRESFTQEQFNRRIEYGHTVLTNYYHKYLNEWNRIVAVELFISHVVVEGVPLKGKLDKLEFMGKAVNVVDYKTGDPDKAKQKLQGPSSKDPIGGDYWRQAVFYKILLDHYGKRDWQALSSEFDFIEPDKKKNYRKQKLFITPEDISEVTRQIKDSWDKIHRHEFYVGCGKVDCHWCNFVKTNNLAVALHEVHEEEPTEEGF